MNNMYIDIFGFGPSHFARFMAGCACEQKKLLYDDIQNYEQNMKIASGMDSSAAQLFAQTLVSQREKADRKYEETDRLGIEGQGPQFEFTSTGDVVFPEFSESTLGSMYERQQNLRPHEYNKAEHDTVVSAYESLRNGATQVAHIVHHYTKEGQLDIRDVVVLTYDKRTNTGTMHMLNIADGSKTHGSLDSARVAMEKRLEGFVAHTQAADTMLFIRNEDPVDPIMLFHQRSVPETSVMVVHPRKVDYDDNPHMIESRHDGEDVSTGVMFDRSIHHADLPVEERIPVRMPEYLQHLMRNNAEVKEYVHTDPIRVKPETVTVLQRDVLKKSILHTSNVSSQFVEKFSQPLVLKDTHRSLRHVMSSMMFVEKTHIGRGAAPVLLQHIRESLSGVIQKNHRIFSTENRATNRAAKKDLKNQSHIPHKENTIVYAKGKKDLEVKKVLISNSHEVKKLSSTATLLFSGEIGRGVKNKSEVRHSQIPERKKRNRKIEKVTNVLLSKEKTLMNLFRKVSRMVRIESTRLNKRLERKRIESKKKRNQGEKTRRISSMLEKPTISVFRSEVRSKRTCVMAFIQSWIAFLLIHSVNTKHGTTERQVMNSSRHKTESVGVDAQSIQQPWILLSIIWHMTMIREQGMSQSNGKKKKKKKIPRLPANGVIYAYQR